MSQILAASGELLGGLKSCFSDDFDVCSAGRFYEFGARRALSPALVDRLVPHAPRADLQGLAREDGTQETLALGDIGLCFAARARMAEQSLILAMRIFNPDVVYECEDRPRCERALRAILLSVNEWSLLGGYGIRIFVKRLT